MEQSEKLERLKQLHQEICELEAFSLDKEQIFEKDLGRLPAPTLSIYKLERRINDTIDMYQEGRYTCSEEEMRKRVNFFVSNDRTIQNSYIKEALSFYKHKEKLEIDVNNYLRVRSNLDNLKKKISQMRVERYQLMLELGMTLSSDNSLVQKSLKRK